MILSFLKKFQFSMNALAYPERPEELNAVRPTLCSPICYFHKETLSGG